MKSLPYSKKCWRGRTSWLMVSFIVAAIVILSKIKDFAHRAVSKASTPYKIVILDEADAMTGAAQAAMRRIIEKFSKTTRLLYICKNEGVEIDEKALTMLVTLCEGDLRRSITYLQSLSCRQNITSDFIFTVTGQVDKKIVDKLFLTCYSSDTDRIVDAVESICRAGYANRSLIDQIYEQLLADDTLKDIQKSAIFEKMAACSLTPLSFFFSVFCTVLE
ncbi:replication factor [Necator americanus]|uniref:Replication factor n=1 Tax=Necator americanus TaxID=51031 RepID=W2SSF2_NECAM|nr:replication factor [Necator americanus]ETN72560.1 replication factor [Necator americanus]